MVPRCRDSTVVPRNTVHYQVVATQSVAYLECAKGPGPGGLGDGSTAVESRDKAPVGGLGTADAFLLMNA